ncbi:Nucleolar protein 12 [Arthrobotrys conoides]|uniref:Nucleolar protein 12 n=1 Tax=Arthrobotrys conoides TaxID=74498 RepID=A0AAN8RLF9_9PEZI
MSKKSKLAEGEVIDSAKEEKKEEKKEKKEKKENKGKKEKSDKGDKKEKKEPKSKSKTTEQSTSKSLFDAPAKAVDDSLASLFSTNAGPVKIAVINSRRPLVRRKEREVEVNASDDDEDEDEEIPNEIANALAARDEALNKDKKKKRKRTTEPEIEDVYMDKLRDEEPEPRKKQKKSTKEVKQPKKEKVVKDGEEGEDEEMADTDGKIGDADAKSDSKNEGDDLSSEKEEGDGDEQEEDESEDGEGEEVEDEEDEDDEDAEEEDKPQERIRHETEGDLQNREFEKANCTVFVGNLPSSIITDKAEHKALQSAFKAHGVVSSIRFRSIAFSDQIPRKAAFITKALHVDQTNVNAYVVFKTPEAARSSLKLNGTVVLNHHIRVDSVAHPAKNDSRKCVFVGNLDFEAAEESLWKHFSTCGKVENVRLVRDAKTNVGKGFAYVQFADDVDVEKALLLNDKPMEVEKGRKRKLRVTRAKNMRKKAVPDSAPGAVRSAKKNGVYVPKADPRQSGAAGRAGKLFGRAGGAKMRKIEDTGVYEGTRAAPGMDVGLRTGGSGKKKGGARARKTVRSAAWKKKPAK